MAMKKGSGVCEFCGKTIPEKFVDNRCDPCWEAIWRIPDFLKLAKGRQLVEKLLKELDA